MENIDDKIKNETVLEAILFTQGEPVSIKNISAVMGIPPEEAENAVLNLSKTLKEQGRGIRLARKDDFVALVTAPETSNTIKKLIKDEYGQNLGQAGIETFSIIIYKGPISRVDIDYIRGVNSNFILRNLMIRGLIERIPNPSDKRSFLYKPSFDALKYLGIENIEDLPGHKEMNEKIEQTLEEKENE